MDAPFWSGRFAGAEVEFIDGHIAAPRILKAALGISKAAREVLEAEPLPSRDRETKALCLRLQTIIRSREFFGALVRLASHERGYRLDSYDPTLTEFRVCAAVEITTVLELEREGEVQRVGSDNVDFFVDEASRKVWIATRATRGVRPKMAKAINRLLGEYGLRDLAPLEAILRIRKEDISLELDDRGIMSWELPDRQRQDWSMVSDDSVEPADSGADPNTDSDDVEFGFDYDALRGVPPEVRDEGLVPPSSDPSRTDEPDSLKGVDRLRSKAAGRWLE